MGGGGGNPVKSIKKSVSDISHNPVNGILNTASSFANVATGGLIGKSQEGLQELPQQQDDASQKAQAEAEVKADQMRDINFKNSGLSSTMLGGKLNEDPTKLKKKKLLGE